MNRIKIEPYKNSFHGEVIECMKRNFPWMRNRTDDEINIWLSLYGLITGYVIMKKILTSME